MVVSSRPMLVFLALVCAASVAGCGQGAKEEYTSYSDLEQAKSETASGGTPGVDDAAAVVETPAATRPDDAASAPASPNSAADLSSDGGGASVEAGDVAARGSETDSNSAARTDAGGASANTANANPETAAAAADAGATSNGSAGDGASANSVDATAANASGNTASGNSGSGTDNLTGPREVRVLVPERDFQVEGPSGALRITYDDIDLLKVLNMEPVTPDAPELMPEWLSSLDQQRVRVRGFMYPTFQETGLTGFVLARDNQICCFGRDPKIYDLIRVRLRDGVTTSYIQGRPFDVVGTFRIKPEVDDGDLYRLYAIEDAEVIVQ